MASIYLEKGFLGFSALSKMSFFPVAEVFRIHGAAGLTIECPCTILSRKALPNGAPDINIIIGQNVYPTVLRILILVCYCVS